MKTPVRFLTTALVVILLALLGACGSSTGGGSPGGADATTEEPYVPDDTEEPYAPDDTEESYVPDDTESLEAEEPAGEIWEWASGRDAFSDPALAEYTQRLGRPETEVHVQPLGFQLDLDSYGTVEAVILYNDEIALGLPASDSSYSAYDGALPGGLSWDLTPGDLGFVYGASNQGGGWGTPIYFESATEDGAYDLEIGFNAAHEYDLPAAQIHWIRVSPSGGS